MKKQAISIRTSKGIVEVNGYVEKGVGIHRVNGDSKGSWTITDLATGMGATRGNFKTRKEAELAIPDAIRAIEDVKIKRPECYSDYVKAFNKLTGKVSNTKAEVKTDKGVKKMANKTNAKAKANTASDKSKALEKENKALKKELEILKKQVEELTRIEKVNIDSFDVEGYLASRDNANRITPELVEALENTKGLTVTRKGKDEWLYVSGATEADTKERKDIFKAMGFRWSANENAWFIAPYPLRSKKAWGAKKARKANATA